LTKNHGWAGSKKGELRKGSQRGTQENGLRNDKKKRTVKKKGEINRARSDKTEALGVKK